MKTKTIVLLILIVFVSTVFIQLLLNPVEKSYADGIMKFFWRDSLGVLVPINSYPVKVSSLNGMTPSNGLSFDTTNVAKININNNFTTSQTVTGNIDITGALKSDSITTHSSITKSTRVPFYIPQIKSSGSYPWVLNLSPNSSVSEGASDPTFRAGGVTRTATYGIYSSNGSYLQNGSISSNGAQLIIAGGYIDTIITGTVSSTTNGIISSSLSKIGSNTSSGVSFVNNLILNGFKTYIGNTSSSNTVIGQNDTVYDNGTGFILGDNISVRSGASFLWGTHLIANNAGNWNWVTGYNIINSATQASIVNGIADVPDEVSLRGIYTIRNLPLVISYENGGLDTAQGTTNSIYLHHGFTSDSSALKIMVTNIGFANSGKTRIDFQYVTGFNSKSNVEANPLTNGTSTTFLTYDGSTGTLQFPNPKTDSTGLPRGSMYIKTSDGTFHWKF